MSQRRWACVRRWATIIKARTYPDASFRDVTAPNADTLYTTAFFDVGVEPWVVSFRT